MRDSFTAQRDDVPLSFTYTYEPNSNLLKTVTGPAHTVTNTYEPNRDVLSSKKNEAGGIEISRYSYQVNAIGQRTNLTTEFNLGAGVTGNPGDTAWGYDPLGQVTSAAHTIPGLDRAYQYDMIGNRVKSADSLTLPATDNYTANALNQYTSIGGADPSLPSYDPDGNMTSGPLPANLSANSTLTWDAENRLTSATVNSVTVNYTYDSQSRRIAETVGTSTKITLYDGWNPIAEYSISNNQYSISKSFTWGMDLSGTMQGAGGVGGLLAVTDSTGTYFPTYDGNGNVSEYLDSTGAITAHYEYDPFGKTTVATGPKANDFAHRFSTKPLDATTGLYYYGYRFYDPNTGRWPSRDPIGENGGINLYGFVRNDGVNKWDLLGLKSLKGCARTGDWNLFQKWEEINVSAALIGFRTTYQYQFGCSCKKRCCTYPHGNITEEWELAWSDKTPRFFTFEGMVKMYGVSYATANNAVVDTAISIVETSSGVPTLPQVNDDGVVNTLDEQERLMKEQFDLLRKAKEVWTAKNNIIWSEMKKKCEESCAMENGPCCGVNIVKNEDMPDHKPRGHINFKPIN